MLINKYKTNAKFFAYDGCHKIYLIEDENDKQEALNLKYKIFPIKELSETYENSCSLRFIDTWKLETIIPQFAKKVKFLENEM